MRIALILLGLALCTVRPCHAAFELRPGDSGGSPMMPLSLPGAFSWPGAGDGALTSPWSVSFLHLSPFGLREVSYDALGVASGTGPLRFRGSAACLSAPGYSELDLTAGALWPAGLDTGVSLLWTQPSAILRDDAGFQSRKAVVARIGWVRAWRTRLRAGIWARDLPVAGDAALLGLAARLGLRMEVQATPSWRVILCRDWAGGDGRDEILRAALAWSPARGCEVGQAWSRGSRFETLWMSAGARRLSACAWSSSQRDGLPGASGCCLSAAGGGASAPRRAEVPADRAEIRTPEAARPPGPPEWDDSIDDALLLDAEVLIESAGADSFGAWSDSLAGCGGSLDTDLMSFRRGAAGSSRFQTIPLSSIRAQDLRDFSALSEAEAEALASFLRQKPVGRLPDLEPVPPGLARALREVVPYLRPADPEGIPEFERGKADTAPRWAYRFLRESKGRTGSAPRGNNRIEGRLLSGERSLLARLDWTEANGGVRQASLGHARGLVRFDSGRVHLLVGRAADPVTWGLGLLGRGRGARLRSQDRPRPETAEPLDTAAGLSKASVPPSTEFLLRPSLSGSEPTWGAEFRGLGGGPYALAAGSGERRWGGIGWDGEAWAAGTLLRRQPGLPLSYSVALRRSGDREETSLEWTGLDRKVAHAGIRWAHAGTPRRSRPVLWWSLAWRQRVLLRDLAPATVLADLKERRLRARRVLRAGWRHPVLSFSAEWDWRSNQDVDEARSARSDSRKLSARGWGRGPSGIRWELRVDGSGHSTRPPELSMAGDSRGNPKTERWRARVVAQTRDRASSSIPLGPGWGIEWGLEQESRRSETGTESGSAGRWFGLSRSGRLGAPLSWSAGLLEVRTDGARGISLAPSWTGGSRVLCHGVGTWLGAGVRGTRGAWALKARLVSPLPAGSGRPGQDPAQWELSVQKNFAERDG